ncbi:hypothetical protein V8C86DRAFT_2613066 [Haematococcus lacustris]
MPGVLPQDRALIALRCLALFSRHPAALQLLDQYTNAAWYLEQMVQAGCVPVDPARPQTVAVPGDPGVMPPPDVQATGNGARMLVVDATAGCALHLLSCLRRARTAHAALRPSPAPPPHPKHHRAQTPLAGVQHQQAAMSQSVTPSVSSALVVLSGGSLTGFTGRAAHGTPGGALREIVHRDSGMRDAAAWWASAASAVKSDAALLPGLPGDAVALLLQRLLLLAWSSQQVVRAGVVEALWSSAAYSAPKGGPAPGLPGASLGLSSGSWGQGLNARAPSFSSGKAGGRLEGRLAWDPLQLPEVPGTAGPPSSSALATVMATLASLQPCPPPSHHSPSHSLISSPGPCPPPAGPYPTALTSSHLLCSPLHEPQHELLGVLPDVELPAAASAATAAHAASMHLRMLEGGERALLPPPLPALQHHPAVIAAVQEAVAASWGEGGAIGSAVLSGWADCLGQHLVLPPSPSCPNQSAGQQLSSQAAEHASAAAGSGRDRGFDGAARGVSAQPEAEVQGLAVFVDHVWAHIAAIQCQANPRAPAAPAASQPQLQPQPPGMRPSSPGAVLLHAAGGDACLVLLGVLLGAGRPCAGRQAGQATALVAALSASPAAAFVWPAFGAVVLGGADLPRAVLCTAVLHVLKVQESELLAALGGPAGLGTGLVLHLAARWLGFGGSCAPGHAAGLAFAGILSAVDVLKVFVLALTAGPDWLVYVAVAVLKHYEDGIRAAAIRGVLASWLASLDIGAAFDVGGAVGYMDGLCAACREEVLTFIVSSVGCNPPLQIDLQHVQI